MLQVPKYISVKHFSGMSKFGDLPRKSFSGDITSNRLTSKINTSHKTIILLKNFFLPNGFFLKIFIYLFF